MRSFTSRSLWALAILAGLSTANAAVVSDSSQCLSEICGESTYSTHASLVARSMPQKPCSSATPTLSHRDLTNAERLGRGLPLKPPVRRSRGQSKFSSMPSRWIVQLLDPFLLGHAARSQVSPIPQSPEPEDPEPPITEPTEPEVLEPVVYQGKIAVRKSDGTSLGYLSATKRSTGSFTYGTPEETALKVTVSLEAGAVSGTNLAITMLVSWVILISDLPTCRTCCP